MTVMFLIVKEVWEDQKNDVAAAARGCQCRYVYITPGRDVHNTTPTQLHGAALSSI